MIYLSVFWVAVVAIIMVGLMVLCGVAIYLILKRSMSSYKGQSTVEEPGIEEYETSFRDS